MNPIGNHFLDRLSAAEFGLLRPYLTEVKLPRGELLCSPGEDIEQVWLPITAILSVVTTMENGHEVEACTIGHESGYGLLNALGSPAALDRVVAQVGGNAIKLPAFRLRTAAGLSLGVVQAVVRHAQANAAQVHQSVACNALHLVQARLCRWLLMTQDRIDSDRLPLTQEFLGFMLGVQRTTVTGVAQSLQAAGLIRYSRGLIEVLDRPALEASACECYEAVRGKYRQVLGGADGATLPEPVAEANRRRSSAQDQNGRL